MSSSVKDYDLPILDDDSCNFITSAPEPPFSVDHEPCPDGGLRAWLVVLGVACGSCATFGFINTWGVFQAYYEQVTLKDRSPSDIAWIGSIQYALIFMPGLVFGRLFDMGHSRVPLAVASILLVVCTFLTAECKEFWQYILCQGFGIGLTSGAIFAVSAAAVPHWFQKKLGLAFGCLSLGSSIGGTIFPIAVKNLIAHSSVSPQWALRILAFVLLGLLTITNLTIKRRLPPRKNLGKFIDWTAFQNPAYAVYAAALLVSFLGLYTCLTYISLSGLRNGVDSDISFYLVAIANCSSIIGRIGGGLTADRIGPLNILIPSTFVAGILTYAWPFATTQGPLIAVAVLYGASSGVFLALMGQPAVQMGSLEDVGRRSGMALTAMSFGALAGPPISGAILDRHGDFRSVGYYAGSMVMASIALMVVVRQLLLRNQLFGKA